MSAGAVLAIGVCALCAAVFGALVKKSNKEYALLLTAAAAAAILAAALGDAAPLIEEILSLSSGGGVQSQCLAIVVKAAGLAVIGQLAAQLCRDAGEATLAYGVELAAKVAILTVAMPLISQLFEFMGEILKL